MGKEAKEEGLEGGVGKEVKEEGLEGGGARGPQEERAPRSLTARARTQGPSGERRRLRRADEQVPVSDDAGCGGAMGSASPHWGVASASARTQAWVRVLDGAASGDGVRSKMCDDALNFNRSIVFSLKLYWDILLVVGSVVLWWRMGFVSFSVR